MNRIITVLVILIALSSCGQKNNGSKRISIAKAGNSTLYYDQVPSAVTEGISGADSVVLIQNFINKWAKKELLYQRAEANISPDLKKDIESQLDETRVNLVIYEYQNQMMLQRMDTVISDEELKSYYAANERSLMLTSDIVKALYIKLPVETPNLAKIKLLARSEKQKDMQELESLCYQFAEKFDDFNEDWVTIDRLSMELNENIINRDIFLKKNSFYETSDSSSVYLISINDLRLRGTLAPFEYVRNDIKRIIWNNRRIGFIQTLENGIYDEALKENSFKIY